MEKTLKICMAGFGNLGKRFSQLLLEKGQYITDEYGCKIVVTGISTRSRGTLVNPEGINLQDALDMVINTGKFDINYPGYTTGDTNEMIEKSQADIFIEMSTLSIEDGQPATDYMKKAFGLGMHVITANKGPEAWHYKELKKIAEDKGLCYLYETIVMDGTPIFNLMKDTLHGNRLLGFRGILNGTSNFVLCQLEKGYTYDEAIKEAQRIGLAEADPSMDMDGWDGAAKLCAMTNILMDCQITPKMVEVHSVANITKEDIEKANAEGYRIKYICEAKRNPQTNEITAKVSPQKLLISDSFSNVNDTSAAVTLYTDLAGEMTIIQTDPGILQTAYGVYSDLITLMKTIK